MRLGSAYVLRSLLGFDLLVERMIKDVKGDYRKLDLFIGASTLSPNNFNLYR
jgi:hypothetical protein